MPMEIKQNLQTINDKLKNTACKLVAVSKTYPADIIAEAYEYGQRIFGENKVQELAEKYGTLPKDIEWHLIGHLQSNKVRYIAPFVSLIHSVDSLKLLKEIDKEGKKNSRIIHCLFQIYIASEDTKFGLSFEETRALLGSAEFKSMNNIKITGLMGMATNTVDRDQVRAEFRSLKVFFESLKADLNAKEGNVDLRDISMGMSSDYDIAIEEGSTLVRVGSAIFGSRHY